MTTTRQLRAVTLAVIMVLSVFAGGIALTGTVAADLERGTDGNFSVSDGGDSNASIGDGATVFQGEDELEFIGDDQFPTNFTTSNDDVLRVPVPIDQAVGSYTNGDGDTIFVDTPRITTFEVQNDANNDVSGGVLLQTEEDASVNVTYNFQEAENMTLTVTDADGLDVTNLWLDDGQEASINGSADSNPNVSSAGSVYFDLNPTDIDPGEYTFTVEGDDDLNFGEATQSTTVTVDDSLTASLALGDTDVVQGEFVTYTVTGATEGSQVTVAIEEGDVTGSNVDVFRDVGDVDNEGSTETIDSTSYVIADLTIDDGQAVGSIDTGELTDDTVTVYVWPDSNDLSGDEDDSVDLTVGSGTVSLTNPTGTYVIGSQVEVAGTASDGVDQVALYARDTGDWELVSLANNQETIEVDPDGTFSEDDIRLSDENFQTSNTGNELLSIPGSYRIAIVATGTSPPDTLDSATFAANTTDTESIVTTSSDLSATFTTYNGQIAEGDDTLDIDGAHETVAGTDVLLVLVGPRGNLVNTTITADETGAFDTDFDFISNQANPVSQGTVTAHVISPGRDGTFGSSGDNAQAFIDNVLYSNDVQQYNGTADQVRSQIISDTIDATASDDAMVSTSFRYANKLTSIASVTSPVAAGDTVTIEGQTNRNPDDADITIEMLSDTGESVALDQIGDWDSDGAWSVEIATEGLELGSYNVEADDGDSTDRVDVEVVDEVATPTPEPEPEPEPEPTPEPTEEPAEETPADTPGFGLIVALTALVAAGFLALRRLD